jgi:hypothetical protein
MFSKLHERLGTAGLVVAVIALVVALGGSAVAALNGGEKKEVKKIAKKFAGKKGATGPAGPAGAAGAAGAKGDKGDPGANGTPGTPGTNGVTGATGATGTAGTAGATGPTGTAGATGATGATGTTGATGPSCPVGYCTLPANSTETGLWSATFAGTEAITHVSFPLPLKAPLDAAHVKVVTGTPPAECDDGALPAPSTGNPEADPGYLCVFPIAFEPSGSIALNGVLNPETFSDGASKVGAAIALTGGADGGFGLGSYAVTGAP